MSDNIDFDYKSFENDILAEMQGILKKWIDETDRDIYIFSLDCDSGVGSIGAIANTNNCLDENADEDSNDYWYYKYCEEEWELFDAFVEVSKRMRKYLDDNNEKFVTQSYEYTPAFNEHRNKVIEACKEALMRLKQSVGDTCQGLLLSLNIREYLDEEERIEIFEKLNGKGAAEEYEEHIEEFV